MKDKVYDLMKNNKGMCCVHKYIHILHSLIDWSVELIFTGLKQFSGDVILIYNYMVTNIIIYFNQIPFYLM